MENYISVKDYAKFEKITVQAVYNRIAKDLVKYKKIGSMFLIKK
tara:strand:- start:1833 stop:1964 length:132 start_codon:yes stop_codon:yes gene_type:complete